MRQQPTNMNIIEIDMRTGAPETVIAFRFESQSLPVSEQSLGPGFDLLAKPVFCWAASTVARLRAVPADQSQANALRAAIGQALQLKRIAVDRHHVSNRCADTARTWFGAEIVGLWRSVPGTASCEEEGERQSDEATHAAT